MEQNKNFSTENLDTIKKSSRFGDFLISSIGFAGIISVCIYLMRYIMLTFSSNKFFQQLLAENNLGLAIFLYSLPLALYCIGVIYFSIKKRWFVVIGISVSPILFIIFMLQVLLFSF